MGQRVVVTGVSMMPFAAPSVQGAQGCSIFRWRSSTARLSNVTVLQNLPREQTITSCLTGLFIPKRQAARTRSCVHLHNSHAFQASAGTSGREPGLNVPGERADLYGHGSHRVRGGLVPLGALGRARDSGGAGSARRKATTLRSPRWQ